MAGFEVYSHRQVPPNDGGLARSGSGGRDDIVDMLPGEQLPRIC
jgi:hypothetical protein